MISRKSEYRYVDQEAMLNIAVDGSVHPIRGSKLVIKGEDEAFLIEAIKERSGWENHTERIRFVRHDAPLDFDCSGFVDPKKFDSTAFPGTLGSVSGRSPTVEEDDARRRALRTEFESYKEARDAIYARHAEATERVTKAHDEEIESIQRTHTEALYEIERQHEGVEKDILEIYYKKKESAVRKHAEAIDALRQQRSKEKSEVGRMKIDVLIEKEFEDENREFEGLETDCEQEIFDDNIDYLCRRADANEAYDKAKAESDRTFNDAIREIDETKVTEETENERSYRRNHDTINHQYNVYSDDLNRYENEIAVKNAIVKPCNVPYLPDRVSIRKEDMLIECLYADLERCTIKRHSALFNREPMTVTTRYIYDSGTSGHEEYTETIEHATSSGLAEYGCGIGPDFEGFKDQQIVEYSSNLFYSYVGDRKTAEIIEDYIVDVLIECQEKLYIYHDDEPEEDEDYVRTIKVCRRIHMSNRGVSSTVKQLDRIDDETDEAIGRIDKRLAEDTKSANDAYIDRCADLEKYAEDAKRKAADDRDKKDVQANLDFVNDGEGLAATANGRIARAKTKDEKSRILRQFADSVDALKRARNDRIFENGIEYDEKAAEADRILAEKKRAAETELHEIINDLNEKARDDRREIRNSASERKSEVSKNLKPGEYQGARCRFEANIDPIPFSFSPRGERCTVDQACSCGGCLAGYIVLKPKTLTGVDFSELYRKAENPDQD